MSLESLKTLFANLTNSEQKAFLEELQEPKPIKITQANQPSAGTIILVFDSDDSTTAYPRVFLSVNNQGTVNATAIPSTLYTNNNSAVSWNNGWLIPHPPLLLQPAQPEELREGDRYLYKTHGKLGISEFDGKTCSKKIQHRWKLPDLSWMDK